MAACQCGVERARAGERGRAGMPAAHHSEGVAQVRQVSITGRRQTVILEERMKERQRCGWAQGDRYIAYHDTEWGVPVHDDRTLFEFLILEGAQAGLSWSTILNKRERYRIVFDEFDAVKVASYGGRKVAALMGDEGIVRNRMKIAAAI